MDKKVFLLSGLCAISLCTLNVQASAPKQIHIKMEAKDNHIPSDADKIELKGKLDYNSGLDDIEAGVTQNNVYLYFNRIFGNVSITIYNESGLLVYTGVVDTSMQQYVVIPILSTAPGTYTVVLDNADGFAEGEFIQH